MRLSPLAILGALAFSAPLVQAGFYRYSCAVIVDGKVTGSDALCKKGAKTDGLVLTSDLKCVWDDDDWYCGHPGPVVVGEGESCKASYVKCKHGLICKPTHKGKVCVDPHPKPSQRAKRSESSAERRDMLCPGSQIACPLVGGRLGYECVDTETNIEQCGGCAVDGGFDCSSLPGVDAVSCNRGMCHVLGCSKGYTFHFRRRACVPQLVLE
ncbi:hypothetical protein JCM10207_004051 [Rhodosporidiobolus poonsookiae]